MMAPDSEIGNFMKKPFMKFITHSASYAFFLTLLGAASQRIEFLLLELLGNAWIHGLLEEWKKHERGALPGLAESACMIYVISLIWGEIRSLYAEGLLDYISDLWNIVDFISNSFYVAWISLRFSAWYTVRVLIEFMICFVVVIVVVIYDVILCCVRLIVTQELD
jgi:transient receptor potential cation channel subfamily C member 4